uniref:hypothetical protein n=1 Tax=Nonomuraea pusilla TaxID=46177 RepID=UPI0006E17B85|nr:hypothetical protein [Nonomuraea pusilla]
MVECGRLGGAGAPAAVAGRAGDRVCKGSFCWQLAERRALVEAALKRWEAETEQITAGLDAVAGPPRESSPA